MRNRLSGVATATVPVPFRFNAPIAPAFADVANAITIGIGAGSGCTGQVLVLHDMLGVTQGKLPRFVRNFMEGSASVGDALRRYVGDVKSRAFPDESIHGY